jgi:hypothetical protein
VLPTAVVGMPFKPVQALPQTSIVQRARCNNAIAVQMLQAVTTLGGAVRGGVGARERIVGIEMRAGSA